MLRKFTSCVKGPVRARLRGLWMRLCPRPLPRMQGGCQYVNMGLRSPGPMMVRRTAARISRCPSREFSMQIRVLAFISIFVAGAAHADSAGDALSEIAKCAGIADSAARLKCFDAAAPRANGAAAQPAREAPSRVEGVGLSTPEPVTRVEDFGKPPPPAQITQITATVIELARTLRGRSIFILDNGQVWRQIDGDDTVVQDLEPGKTMKVAIEMGIRLLGNYNLTIEGQNALIRVR